MLDRVHPPPTNATSVPRVFAVIPVFNRMQKTFRFLRSLPAITYPNLTVVIIDDGSWDGVDLTIALSFPDTIVLQGDGDLWWAGATNMGVRYALAKGADYILTINDDCQVEPDFLDHMVDAATPNRIVGCRIHREDLRDRIWSIGTSRKMRGREIFALNYAEETWPEIQHQVADVVSVDSMAGNGVLIPRGVFERVGFYDERHMPQYHADTDFVLRAAADGFRPVIATTAVLYNHIITEPLVNTRLDLIFNRKSDRYWRAIWHILKRYGPRGRRAYLMWMHYAPLIAPDWLRAPYRAIKRLVG